MAQSNAQLKDNTYQVFGNMAQSSEDVYNNLQSVQNDYLNHPEQQIANINSFFKETYGDKFDRNTALAANYNGLAASGVDPNSYTGQYAQNAINSRMMQDSQNNYLNQVLGIQSQGMQLGQNLLSQGINAGNAEIGGIQQDRALDLRQQQIQNEKEQADKKSSIGRGLLGMGLGMAARMIGNAVLPGVGGMIGGALAKGIVGGG